MSGSKGGLSRTDQAIERFFAAMERLFDRVEVLQERATEAFREFVYRHQWVAGLMLLGFVGLYVWMFWYGFTHEPPARRPEEEWHLPDWSVSTWTSIALGVGVVVPALWVWWRRQEHGND
ncbi:hypothetical protein [Tsukamurella sp. USMM236]|uniref:hypothetical protein n=1 Tax=Tsukamurella sp. USMM236 TaxID=3081301 RepID=UPI00301A44AF